jgi:hypothetical protein
MDIDEDEKLAVTISSESIRIWNIDVKFHMNEDPKALFVFN